jgi:hypothetical protein
VDLRSRFWSAYTNPFNRSGPSFRNAPNWNIDDTMNRLRGKHSIQLGGSFNRFEVNRAPRPSVPV